MQITKISTGSPIDFAAEELKKYLRMMMPEGGDVKIVYEPNGKDGFRLGLLSDFGLDDGDVEDPALDDILYAECIGCSGIIAGNNPRSVLLAVYEYLRQNGCRWLYPGVDGEYIPMKDAENVSFRIKPSCRHRGFANTTAASQQTNLDMIDFIPKIGMNTFMFEFRVPTYYTDNYYDHKRNSHNRPSEHVTPQTILQWKRACESEIAKRGLTFHDVGHGFCIDPFGIDSNMAWYQSDEIHIPDNTRKYLAEVNGKRGFFGGVPINTQFCMSNPEARAIVAKYVADYAENHSNVDILHVWLADGINNHCECENCRKKIPSDWYMDLMNDIDDEMTPRGIPTKIVFICYVDTSWAPQQTKIKNPERFIFMLAPFTCHRCETLPPTGVTCTNPPYERNNIQLAQTMEEYYRYYLDWRKDWKGPAFAFDYHFCWPEYHDPSTLTYVKRIVEDIQTYKEYGIDGIVEDGDMRGYLPNGLQIYTYARSLFDTSLSAEDIWEDYFPYIYGDDWKEFLKFFEKVGTIFDFTYFQRRNSADERVSKFYNPEIAKRIEDLPEVLAFGRKLVDEHYNSDIRVQTVSVRLLEYYLELLEKLGEIVKFKAVGDDESAKELYNKFELDFGKYEPAIEKYFNQCFFFNFLNFMVFSNSSNMEFVL